MHKITTESRGNLPTIQIPDRTAGWGGPRGKSQAECEPRLAFTKEAKTETGLYKQNVYHRASDVICLVGSALIKPQGVQDKATSVRHCLQDLDPL